MNTPISNIACLFGLFSFMVVTSASEVHPKGVANGSEIELNGGFFHGRNSGAGALNLDVGYGYYPISNWEAGLRQALNINLVDNARDVRTATTTPFVQYHLPVSGNVVPVVGGFMGLVWNDQDATGTPGPHAGAKFFHDQTYLTTAYRYEWFFDIIKAGGVTRRANLVLNLGIGFVWGGVRK